MTVVPGHEPGWLVGLALDLVADDGVTTPMPASLLFIGEDGSVIDAPAPLTRLLAEVATHASRVPSEAERRQALAALMPVVRGRLHLAASALWRAPRRTPEQRLLERRLRGLARRAVQRRDRAAMTRIDALHAWLAGGLTAGEAILIGRAVSLGNEPQLGLLDRLATRRRRRETAVPRLTGVVRVASFRSCTPSGRFSSTSTEP
jgi:hypothetical protein